MKKNLLILSLFLAFQASAQKFGFRAGANFSKFTTGDFLTTRLNANGSPALNLNGKVISDNIKESLDSRSGFVAGFWFRLGRSLYIQPEVLVSTKQGTFDIIKNGSTTPSPVDVKLTTLDVPLLFGMKANFLRLNAGPMMSLRLSNDQSLVASLKEYTNSSLDNVFAKSVWSYQAGGGIDIGTVSFDLRYEGSLSDVSALNLSSVAGSNQFSQRSKSWQATLAFKIL